MNVQSGKLNEYKPIKFVNKKYVISWGLKKISEEQYKWYYFVLNNKPNANDIKDTINNYINELTKTAIETMFYWNGMNIKLSLENQIDYKLLYDVTVLQNGENLPEKLKFKVNGENIFYEIESLEELKDLIIKMNNHIRQCVNNGYNMKESIDYLEYKL